MRTADPSPTSIPDLFFIPEVSVARIAKRLFVLPESPIARLSTPAEGMYRSVKSQDILHCEVTVFATLYVR